MATDPRIALRQFTAALERHLEAVATRRGPEDPSVEAEYEKLLDAFLDYEESLSENFEEYLPFVQDDYDE